jgi:hypothetical protein
MYSQMHPCRRRHAAAADTLLHKSNSVYWTPSFAVAVACLKRGSRVRSLPSPSHPPQPPLPANKTLSRQHAGTFLGLGHWCGCYCYCCCCCRPFFSCPHSHNHRLRQDHSLWSSREFVPQPPQSQLPPQLQLPPPPRWGPRGSITTPTSTS